MVDVLLTVVLVMIIFVLDLFYIIDTCHINQILLYIVFILPHHYLLFIMIFIDYFHYCYAKFMSMIIIIISLFIVCVCFVFNR